MIGIRDLRTMCRPPMGVPVTFAGVANYADDGTPICGLFDSPSKLGVMYEGIGGVELDQPTLRLPFNAFTPMPNDGDTLTADGVTYQVNTPDPEDDGAFLCYQLQAL